VVRRLHRTVIKRPTVPLQEDANVIGPLPPGLYKVAAEAQEAGCSIVTEPIPLVGATQRRHTAWLPINWLWQRKAAQSPMGRQRQAQSEAQSALMTVLPLGGFQRKLQPGSLYSDSKTASRPSSPGSFPLTSCDWKRASVMLREQTIPFRAESAVLVDPQFSLRSTLTILREATLGSHRAHYRFWSESSCACQCRALQR
jgi:hypothetical protein